jgi:hypothetical protein
VDGEWVDLAGLIGAAEEHGHRVSARSLEEWRYRGLLPRASRRQGGRAVWLYPPVARRQLLRLLHWRQGTRSLDLIRVALWVDGFEVGLDGVRCSLAAFVDSWARALDREVGDTRDQSARIGALARRVAGKRGLGALPRKVRMSAAERERACGYGLALMLGAEEEIARRREDAVLLERMLGFRSGRGDGLAAVMPLDEDTLRMARLPSPERVHAVIAAAPAEELEYVRRILNAILVWLPLVMPVILAEYGAKAVALIDVAADVFEDPQPQYYAFAVLALLISLHAKAHAVEDLRAELANMSATTINREMLEMLPEAQRASAIRRLSPGPRENAGAS